MHNQVKHNIQQLISTALKAQFDIERQAESIHLEHPADAAHGDWSTNVAMTLAKELQTNPRDIATKLVAELQSKLPEIEKVELAGAGFINFYISPSIFKQTLATVLQQAEKYGKGEALVGKRIMLEYAHPNPFKSFHIGHLRNILLGVSLIQLLENQSAEVIPVNYQGDVGMHIAKCLWSFRKVSPDTYPTTADERVKLLGACYAEGADLFEKDEAIQAEIKDINKLIYTGEDAQITELWELGKKWSLEKFQEIYDRVGAKFVKQYMESEVMELGVAKVNEAIEKGILEESEGAVIFDGTKYGMDKRVFLNSQKLPTYEGKELGLAYREFTDYGNIDLCIHNVAVEQISFFKVTFKVEELLDSAMFAGKQYHNAYEFVGLKKGKMSSRTGNVILGNDILNDAREKIGEFMKEAPDADIAEKLGVAAVKYSFLKVSPRTYLAFDFDESLSFEGDSGPYLMYTFTRAKSMLNQADGYQMPDLQNVLGSEVEGALLKHLGKFPEVTATAAAEYAPHLIALYLHGLAQLYNTFYNSLPVLKAEEPDRSARLALTAATAQVIQNGLKLLGIETVERM
jgi:arginyl-tRNA synthetase